MIHPIYLHFLSILMEEYPFSAQNTTSCLENLRGIADSDRTPDPTPNPSVLLIIIPSGKYSVIDFLPSGMCQVIVGTFSSFFDISLFLLFSDNSARTLSDHFMFLFNRMLLQGLSSMLSALRPIAAYDA